MKNDHGITDALQNLDNLIEKCNGYKWFLEKTQKDLENGADPLECMMGSRFTHIPLMEAIKQFINDNRPHIDLIEPAYKVITNDSYFLSANGFTLLAIKKNEYKILNGTPSSKFHWNNYDIENRTINYFEKDLTFETFENAINSMLKNGYDVLAFRSLFDLDLYCSNKFKQNLTKLCIDISTEFGEILDQFERGKPITKLCYGLNAKQMELLLTLRKELYCEK